MNILKQFFNWIRSIGTSTITTKISYQNVMNIEVPIYNESNNELPAYATTGSSGLDLRANLPDACVVMLPNEIRLIPTGLHVAIPKGYEMQIRPRSGLALKHGISMVNTPGTIDSDYRGGIGIILINHGTDTFVVNHGDRIAQAVFAPVVKVKAWTVVNSIEELSATDRGEGGFSSTGIK